MLEKKEYVKVSIIIPVYNVEKYIEKCIISVLNQTYKNIEIIVIDDGSTDDSYKILKKYAEMDNRIKLIKRENRGVCITRLEGIEKSTGEYIMFVDADDWIDNEMIENMISLILKYDADVCKCGIQFEKGDTNEKIECVNVTNEELYVEKMNFKNKVYNNFILTHMLCSIDTQLIKKDKIKLTNINTTLSYAEDLQFNLNLYTGIEKVVFTEKNYYHYVENQMSITRTYTVNRLEKNLNDAIFVYSSLFKYLEIWKMDDEYNKKIVANRILKEIASNLLRLSRAKDANIKFIKSKLEKIYNNEVMIYINKNLQKKEIENANIFMKKIQKEIYSNNTNIILALIFLIYLPLVKIKGRNKNAIK